MKRPTSKKSINWKQAFTGFFMLTPALALGQLPTVASGKLERLENFDSRYVTARNVDIWLPEGYDGKKTFSVLYMHDGQMLYDSATTWNKQSWDIDETLAKLLKEGKVRNAIVVGIWNGGATRYPDYCPQKPFETLTQAERDTLYNPKNTGGNSLLNNGKVQSDDYLRFLVTELKPHIDKHYSTKADRANTFVAGSSMGGLISMYAICEYPDVFGGAACISTHWPGVFNADNPLPRKFLDYLQSHLPDPKTHKIYFDTGDATLDALYPPLQKQVDEIMKAAGWNSNNWVTRYFPGDDHTERSWRRRLNIPLTFLLAE